MSRVRRRSAKVLLLDPGGRVLLFRGLDPARPDRVPIWFPVGGGAHDGETMQETAVREVKEETGLRVTDLGSVVMTRQVDFEFDGVLYDQDEAYFAVRTETFSPAVDGWTATERAVMVRHRWWTADELRRTTETVFPEGLADLVDRLRREE